MKRLKRRRHLPIPQQGRWLERVVRGHYRYYAVHGNAAAARMFRERVTRNWRKALRRRSQRTGPDWERMDRLAALASTGPDPAALAWPAL